MAGKAFFMKRLNEHVQYLKKMDARLKNDSDFPGCSHVDCELGKWLYNQGKEEIANMKDPNAQKLFDSLFDPHERFHQVGREALQKKDEGDEAAVKKLMTEMHVLSTIITNKLLELDSMN